MRGAEHKAMALLCALGWLCGCGRDLPLGLPPPAPGEMAGQAGPAPDAGAPRPRDAGSPVPRDAASPFDAARTPDAGPPDAAPAPSDADPWDGGPADAAVQDAAPTDFCGDGLVSPYEHCDIAIEGGAGACPDRCDQDPCQRGTLYGSECLRECSFVEVREADDQDGCCPRGLGDLEDADCTAACGNGAIDSGEACDDLGTDDGDGCSADCTRVESCSLRERRTYRDGLLFNVTRFDDQGRQVLTEYYSEIDDALVIRRETRVYVGASRDDFTTSNLLDLDGDGTLDHLTRTMMSGDIYLQEIDRGADGSVDSREFKSPELEELDGDADGNPEYHWDYTCSASGLCLTTELHNPSDDGTPEVRTQSWTDPVTGYRWNVEAIDSDDDGGFEIVEEGATLQGIEVVRRNDLDGDGTLESYAVTVLDARGFPQRVEWDYDLDAVVDEIRSFGHDDSGGLIYEGWDGSANEPADGTLDRSCRYTRYARGALETSACDTDGDGAVDLWQEYYEDGVRRSSRSLDGSYTETVRDAQGRELRMVRDVDGDGLYELDFVTTYDAFGRLESIERRAGTGFHYALYQTYASDDPTDPRFRGLRRSETHNDTDGIPDVVEVRIFNAAGVVLLRERYQDGELVGRTSNTLDDDGNLVDSIEDDTRYERKRFEYDLRGFLVRTTSSDGWELVSSYDAGGHELTRTRTEGAVQTRTEQTWYCR